MLTPKIIRSLTLLAIMTISGPVLAEDASHAGHDMSGAASHAGHQMDKAGSMGDMVHESKVEGYTISYHLIDNLARLKASGQTVDPSQVKSNHLMVYLTAPDGKPVDTAQVGYLVKNPDGGEQKVMAMAMAGGFGADVNLAVPGKYTIKTKIVAAGKTLIDEYPYERK